MGLVGLGAELLLAEQKTEYHRHFTSDPLAVANVVEELVEQFACHRLAPDDVSDIEIVLCEVINNINEHAYCGASDRPIELHAETGQNGICFRLVDCGVAMPGGVIPVGKQADLTGCIAQLPEGGFGWSLIRQLAHDIQYVRKNGENHISFCVTIHTEYLPI